MTSSPSKDDAVPTTLTGFRLAEVLDDAADQKTITVLGSFDGKPGQAIIKLSRRHFERADLAKLLEGVRFEKKQFHNDIYSKYTASLPAKWGYITADITYPATEKHIRKARKQEYHMVRESPEMYRNMTLPHIESIPEAHIKWVHNILERKAEAERLLFEDSDAETGFMLHPDLKWDQAQKESLYCVAICHSQKVRSLRDLTAEHLPLLRNIRDKASEAIRDKFGVQPDRLRFYVHYQPSYYWFHVHIVHVGLPTPGASVGKAHLLDDIIDNLANVSSDYYQKRTLTYSLGANDALMERLRKRKAPEGLTAAAPDAPQQKKPAIAHNQ